MNIKGVNIFTHILHSHLRATVSALAHAVPAVFGSLCTPRFQCLQVRPGMRESHRHRLMLVVLAVNCDMHSSHVQRWRWHL